MGLIERMLQLILGGGDKPLRSATLLEVFRELTKPKRPRLSSDAQVQLLSMQVAHEFRRRRGNWFDKIIDGLNRLPRPILALGTVGLFVFSMVDPIGFSERMIGLDTVPRELWWLLAAIVSFYFGARELHYVRDQRAARGPSEASRRKVPGSR